MRKAFTLIEMLVVVTVIGILATSLAPKLQDTQARARDTKRKSDLTQIRNALEVYYNDYGQVYPINVIPNYFSHSTNSLTARVPELTPNYLSILPIDPVNNFTGPNTSTFLNGSASYVGQYAYTYYSFGPNGNVISLQTHKGTYMLYTVLENHADPARCEVRGYTTTYKTTGTWSRCRPLPAGSWGYVYVASIAAGAEN